MDKVPSDIEIARAAAIRPIGEIGDKLEIPSESLLPYGPTKAKISNQFIESLSNRSDGKLILVTAIPNSCRGREDHHDCRPG